MENNPSKFASWSLVTSALILAAGIVGGAVILQRGGRSVAAPPQTSKIWPPPTRPPAPTESNEQDIVLTREQYAGLVASCASFGWKNYENGLTRHATTNRAVAALTGHPIPPFTHADLRPNHSSQKP